MNVLEMARGEGKTTAMVCWLLHDPSHMLIVASAQRREVTLRVAAEVLGEEIGQSHPLRERVLLAHYAAAQLRGRRNVVLGIDDLDDVLSALFVLPVEVVTLTRDED